MGVEKGNLAKEQIAEKSMGEKPESRVAGDAAGGGKFTSFTKSISGTLSGLRESTANVQVSEEGGEKESAEKQAKTTTSTGNPPGAGRFTKFTESISGSLSGLRETTAHAKVTEENEGRVSKKSAEEQTKGATSADNSTEGGRFTKISKSFSGIGLLQAKADSTDPKKSSEGDKTESMTQRTLASIGNSSLGKLLLEDAPRPKTRFQRLKEEESDSLVNSSSRKLQGLKAEEVMSFEDGSNEAKDASAASGEESESNALFDDENEIAFADVPLSDDEVNTDGVQEEAEGMEGN